jgi:hypothetical protein
MQTGVLRALYQKDKTIIWKLSMASLGLGPELVDKLGIRNSVLRLAE